MFIQTPRLMLRPWKETDIPAFRALNADHDVMRHFPSVLTAEESDALAESIQTRTRKQGFGLLALEIPGVTDFAGFVGLNVPSFDSSLVEIGWRLHKNCWGHGFATEAAATVLEVGFSRLGMKSICSFTAVTNIPSERVMQRLGMEHHPEKDFNHPALPPDHRLSRHIFYLMTAEQWKKERKCFPFLDDLIVR